MAANDISGINPTGTPPAMDSFGAANQAISTREQLPDLAQKLREALTEKISQSPLIQQRQTALQQFTSAPEQIRADISNMQQTSGVPLSPTQQAAITSSRRAAAYAPLSTNSLMLSSAFGGLEDMVGSGVKAFESAANAQSERANLLNQMRQQEIDRQFKERELRLKELSVGSGQSKASQAQLQKLKEDQAGLNEALTAIQNARAALSNGGAGFSGLFAGLRKRLPTGLGGISNETSILDSALSTVNQRIFETSGKALTETEANILGGRIPKISYQPAVIETALNELEGELLRKQISLLDQGDFQSDPLDNFWE